MCCGRCGGGGGGGMVLSWYRTLGGRGRQISEFKARVVYNSVSKKKKNKQTKKKPAKQHK